MFDLATRPLPEAAAALNQAAMPFDWRLAQAGPERAYPYTVFNTGNGVPVAGISRLATYAMLLEDSLATAVILSLFTDGRAGADDKLPAGQTDRRGWVGDAFVPGAAAEDAWGSRLWLVTTGKVTADVLERARFAAQEALDWLVRDGIASQVTVTTLWAGPRQDRLAVRPTIYKPDQVAPVYDVLWGTTMQRWAQ